MTRDFTVPARPLARPIAVIGALAAGGLLATSLAAADPAAGDSAVQPSNNETWITKTVPAREAVDRAAGEIATAPRASETWIMKSYLAGPDAKDGDGDAGKTGDAAAGQKEGDASGKEDKLHAAFRPGPTYETNYNPEEQLDIYGGKSAVEPPRPLLEIGREQYTSGAYDPSGTLLGELNPLLPGFAVYGDWRTAVAYNRNNGKDIGQIATRLNLDVDFKITGTERIHAFFTPLQEGAASFTRYEFAGGDADERLNDELDPEPQTLFFEGDFGSLYSGFSGTEASFDLPFTVGLFPLFLQNGIWANDAILGGAVSLPAKNSAALGLANFDITFFAAFDDVDNASTFDAAFGKFDNDNVHLYGATAFIDAFSGYIETGYGFVQGYDDKEGLEQHFITAAYTRRFANTVSNSTRVFANFGDDGRGNGDGFAIISENSLVTSLPSTLLPYANFFVGFETPAPLVDGNNAGILKNVGINFETDALTGYPKLDDTASNAFGGAIGLQYLFNLDQQVVVEAAMVQPFEDDGIGAKDAQYGLGARYQVPIDRAWLFRADATYHIFEGAEDNFGLRTEVRRKF
jgi:hypothetical protein